jgi:hypothetical protein
MSPKVSIELINLGCEQVVSGGADLIAYTPGTVQVIAEEYLAAGMATDLEGGAPRYRWRQRQCLRFQLSARPEQAFSCARQHRAVEITSGRDR